jgi:DNA-binding MarR family transcriptional regulator
VGLFAACEQPTIGVLAERMQLQHHSTVELIDRLVDRGFVCRLRATDDRRQVLVKLTSEGDDFLKTLSLHHLEELQNIGPKFVKVLQSLIGEARLSRVITDAKILAAGPSNKVKKETSHG